MFAYNVKMKKAGTVNRRDFIKASALLSGGLLISFTIPGADMGLRLVGASRTSAPSLNAFLSIGEDDSIHITLSKIEIGQGISTTLPMLIAEELDCDWKKIKVEHKAYGGELHDPAFAGSTGGSSSTWSEFDRYRQAGATARMMLVNAAAKRLGIPTDDCRTENGFVIAGGNRLRYGDLAVEASKLTVPAATLRQAKDWKFIGKSQRRVDIAEKVNGTAKYGMDIQFAGFLTAVVAHPPTFGGKVKSFDSVKAKAIKGVRDVVQIPSGIAVIGDHFWVCKLGRDALEIEWDLGAGENFNSKQQLEEYSRISKTKGLTVQQKGDVTKGLERAAKTIDLEFYVPYLAHAPMEPLNCTVKLTGNQCEIWTGTQWPELCQKTVASLLGLRVDQILINTPCIGGSFGRRGSFDSDWLVEAVHIAKVSGKAIKLIWSREDDIKAGYYRPAYLHRVVVGLNSDGFPQAWQHRIVGQSLFIHTALEDMIVQNGIDYGSVDGVNGSPYFENVPDHSLELHTTSQTVPVLPWRAVGNTHSAFVMETLIDELAALAAKDPVAYRRILLRNHPRHLAALNLAVEKAEWGKPLPAGRFRGVAVHLAMESYVSQIVEVSIEQNKIHVHRVVCAIDCGLAVNPDGVKAQMESGIIFGLTAALYGEITLENGKVKQSNFNDYKMLRINETPIIEVHIVASTEKMGGAGEPGVPPIAPALVNALFAATGKRVRRLPIKPADLV